MFSCVHTHSSVIIQAYYLLYQAGLPPSVKQTPKSNSRMYDRNERVTDIDVK